MPHTTAFDKVADKFWQEYQNGTPIGGGMAFETQVRACELDETTDSLKKLDRLLIAIKEKITADESALLAQKEFRNFLLFLGFYVGRVVANYRPKLTFHWQSFDELKEQYKLSEQDKFYKMAAFCPDTGKPFFVWLSLGARLFGSFNRKFNEPTTGTLVPESLYWAVQAYFDELSLVDAPTPQAVPQAMPQSQPTPMPMPAPKALPAQEPKKQPPPKPTASKKGKAIPQKDPFDEVKADLVNLPAKNDVHDEHYHKANNFLAKANQSLLDGVSLDDNQLTTVSAALSSLEKVAEAGHTGAMLSLAIYYFEGRLAHDEPKAVSWVQRSAEAGDVRAQKLLSRLYYQGLGVNPSTDMGKLWLDRAAEGGHKEARVLRSQMNAVKAMSNDYRSEIKQDKRMYVMLAVAGVVFLVVMWMLAKFIAK